MVLLTDFNITTGWDFWSEDCSWYFYLPIVGDLFFVNKITVFTSSLLNKKLIGNEPLGFHDSLATHEKFLNKLHNLLVFLNQPDMKPIIRSTLEYTSDIAKVLRIKCPGHSQGAKILPKF